jgi:hypothetical protein
MARYMDDRRRRSWPRERGTLAHFGGGEGIHPDDVERDNMLPAKRRPGGRHDFRGFGEDRGLGPGGAVPRRDDSDDDWRRAMHGQGSGGYGGQYAGMAAGLQGRGRSMRPDPPEMLGSYGETGGSQRGRGPKGYVRGDERMYEDVCERLGRDHALDASDIEVRVQEGKVTLAGTVTADWAKRRAEELAMVRGVRHVQNNLRVRGGRQA